MKTVGVGLLSYGLSGKIFHAPFIRQHHHLKLVGSWERSKQLINKDYPDAKSYSSFEALLDDTDIDLVVVNTPTYTHYDYALRTLNAGKHVLVEKAFTTTAAEAIHLNEIADQNKLVLAVYQNRRYDSDFSTVREIVKINKLGQIHRAEFGFLRFSPTLKPKLHFENPGPGAGLLFDLGPHLIDQALSLFGMPKSVSACLRILRDESKVIDDFELLLRYESLIVRVYSSLLVNETMPAYVLHGRKGSFIKSRSDKQEALLRAGAQPDNTNWFTEPSNDYGSLFTLENGILKEERIQSMRGSYLNFYDSIYNAIATGSDVPVAAADGIRVMQIIEAAIKSGEQSAEVML